MDNWGRWGDADERGALNLITDEKRRRSVGLVTSGRVVSLARPVRLREVTAGAEPQSRIRMGSELEAVTEELRLLYHGDTFTHLDSLGHIWDGAGMWGGRDPESAVGAGGLAWGGVQAWREGVVTRGVLLDVCRSRGVDFVTTDAPVTGDELVRIARADGMSVQPGDAVAVHCGRERWEAAGRPGASAPGLHPSCVDALAAWDCAALLWDQNEIPADPDAAYRPPVHSAIWRLGVAVVDGAKLDELATVCEREGRRDFLLVVAPLNVEGGSGSPVNPLALL